MNDHHRKKIHRAEESVPIVTVALFCCLLWPSCRQTFPPVKGKPSDFTLSPDGRWLAYATNPKVKGAPSLYVLPLRGGGPRKWAGSGLELGWSPDSTKLCWFGYSKNEIGIFTASVESGEVERILYPFEPFVVRGVWSANGQWIAFAGPQDIIISTADGRERRHYHCPENSISTGSVCWGPTARHLYFLEHLLSDPEGTSECLSRLVRLDTVSFSKTILVPRIEGAAVLHPDKNRQRLFFSVGNQIWVWDQTLKKEQPVRISSRLRLAVGPLFDCSPSGKELIVRDVEHRLWLVRVANGHVQHLADDVEKVQWVSDDLIVYATSRDPEKHAADRDPEKHAYRGFTVWRVRRNGSERRVLAEFE